MLNVSEYLHGLEQVGACMPIAGFPRYEVSCLGFVRLVGSDKPLTPTLRSGNLRVGFVDKFGYVVNHPIHRLVASAFLGMPGFAGAQIDHNDGNRTNNRVTNLRWASVLEQRVGRLRSPPRPQDRKTTTAKLDEREVLDIRVRLANRDKQNNIAEDYGVSRSVISAIKCNRAWSHV